MVDKKKQKAAKIRWAYAPDEVEFLVRMFLNRVDYTNDADRHRWYQLMRHGRDSLIMNIRSLDTGKPKLAQAFVDELARQKARR